MTPGLYFLSMVLGVPIALLGIAMIGAHFYRDGPEQLLDWKPTRSPKKEAELCVGDAREMLEAVNRYRRERGAPDRSLEELVEHGWAGLERYDD